MKRLLTKEEKEKCIPTEKELADYLATPDDEIATKLRNKLSPEDFKIIGFVILYTENLEKAQDAKTAEIVRAEERERIIGFVDGNLTWWGRSARHYFNVYKWEKFKEALKKGEM